MSSIQRMMQRRSFLGGTAAAGAVAGAPAAAEETPLYGLIGKMLAKPGRRDELVAVLLEGAVEMPGCLSYVVASDPTNADAIWVTEVWKSPGSHRASLKLPAVRAAIAKGRPLIAGFGERFETAPVAVISAVQGRD